MLPCQPRNPTDQVSARRLRLEHRLADTLYRELEQGKIHRPGWDAARVAAYLLSAVILLLPLACLLAGIALLVFYRPLWLSGLLAIIMLGLALALRPRANRLASDTHLVYREQAPLLFALLDKIAAAIGTKPVHMSSGTARTATLGTTGWSTRLRRSWTSYRRPSASNRSTSTGTT